MENINFIKNVIEYYRHRIGDHLNIRENCQLNLFQEQAILHYEFRRNELASKLMKVM